MESAPVCSLFLPSDEVGASGFLVGWNPHSFMCTVCAVVPSASTTLDALEDVLATCVRTIPALSTLVAHCGGAPTVLGIVLPRGVDLDATIRPRAEAAELWLTLDAGIAGPSLRAVHCCGCRHRAPLQLMLFRRSEHGGEWRTCISLDGLWDSMAPSQTVAAGDVGGATTVPPTGSSALALTLRHASASGEWQRALLDALSSRRTTPRAGDACTRSNNEGERIPSRRVRAARPGLLGSAVRGIGRVVLVISAPWLLGLRALAALGLWLLRGPRTLPRALAPVRWSFAARQAEARLVRAIEWPHRWRAVMATPLWEADARRARIHTYGELTCGVIDASLGVAFAALLARERVWLCTHLALLQASLHEAWLPGVVRWLMGVDPGGFKLNENLNVALGNGVLSLLQVRAHGAR